jgi:hypothetical protein
MYVPWDSAKLVELNMAAEEELTGATYICCEIASAATHNGL